MYASILDMNDPQTFWLNVTNLFLGAVCIACVLMLFGGVFSEVFARVRHRAVNTAAVDDHTFSVADLGTTMADGGTREDNEPKEHE
jgi:hypothetical protein